VGKLFLKKIECFLKQRIEPIAQDIDHDSQILQIIFADFKALDILKLFIPQAYEGSQTKNLFNQQVS